MNWGQPFFLYLLLLIPLFILFIVISSKQRIQKFSRFASPTLYKFFNSRFSLFHWNIKIVMLILTYFFLIIALARPQWDKETQIVRKEGIDLVICIDVSKSMEATDLKPSRLERAKSHINMFVNELNGDRVGIVAFAGKSMVLCPLTDDYQAVKLFVSTLDTETIKAYGTNIGSALEKANKLFPKNTKNKIIILISDGEDLSKTGLDSAKKIGKKGVNLFTIGIGSIDGSPIQLSNTMGESEYAKDDSGNIIISKMDVETLSKMSQSANGKFYPITPQQTEINDILHQITGNEKHLIATKQYSKFKEQYHFFVILALISLLIDLLIIYGGRSVLSKGETS